MTTFDNQDWEGASTEFRFIEGESKSSLTYRIYHTIKEEILIGRLEPGERLNVVHLSKQYNVSRTPVKYALGLLEKDDLVSIEAGKQAVVKCPSVKEVVDIFLFRRQLEPLAAKMSAKYVPENELIELKRELKTLRFSPKIQRARIDFDRRLHGILWRYLDLPMVRPLFRVLNDYSARAQRFAIDTVNDGQTDGMANDAEHLAIIDALLERDGEKARRAVQNHLTCSCQRVLTYYKLR